MADQLSNDLASLRISREAEGPPSSRGRYLVVAVVVVVAAAAAWLAIASFGRKVFKTEVHATEIALVSPAQASVDLTSTGYVVAQVTSKVAAKVSGRVAAVEVKEGDGVKQGQVLARLDDAPQRLAAAAAKARAENARATLEDLKTQLAREKRLLAGDASAPANVEDLENRVRAQEAATKAAEAEAEAAQVSLGYTVVTAPINGRVTAKPVSVGEFVGPGTQTDVADLADFTSLVVETDVPEGRLSKVRKGGPAEIVLDAYPDRRFRGEVTEIVPKVDRAKATVVVKVRFVDEQDVALPDMAARVSFLSAALDPTSLKEPPKLVVPASAIAQRNGSAVVFRIDEGHARVTPVVLGDKFGSGFELKSGPPSGTRVVANPPATLDDGAPVKEVVD